MQFHRILLQIKQLLRPVMEIPDILDIPVSQRTPVIVRVVTRSMLQIDIAPPVPSLFPRAGPCNGRPSMSAGTSAPVAASIVGSTSRSSTGTSTRGSMPSVPAGHFTRNGMCDDPS